MQGQGVVDLDHPKYYNSGKGILKNVMKKSKFADLYKHIIDEDGNWIVRNDVFVRYQTNQRWYLQAQYESLSDQDNSANDVSGYSFLVAYIPTEFSSIRAQYDSFDDGQAKRDRRFLMQLNISIGAHPAHMY